MPPDQLVDVAYLAALSAPAYKGEKANQIRALIKSGDRVELTKWVLGELSESRCDQLRAILADYKALGIQTVVLGSGDYPPLLGQIVEAPLLLYARGDGAILGRETMIAVVGARNSSPSTDAAAFEMAKSLASRGATIVSGLAYGIDAAAHRGAMASGMAGSTIAVVAHGLDRVYPAAHRGLAHQIIESGGAIISQFQLGVNALPHHFLIRNHVIAAMSVGTFVIQAAERSGSLATARAALDAGREVLTLPGDYADQRFRGSNRLLRDGAHLIAEPQDLDAIFPWLRPRKAEMLEQVSEHQDDQLLQFLRCNGETALSEIPEKFGDLSQLSARLVELELDGLVLRQAANTYCATPWPSK